MTEENIDQSGQIIEGSQVNAGGDVHIDHQGGNIDTGGGDYVARDKIIKQYIETKTIVSVESLQAVEKLEPTQQLNHSSSAVIPAGSVRWPSRPTGS